MKKTFFMIALAAAAVTATAQNPVRMPLAESVNAPSYAVPNTVVKVTLTVEQQTVVPGPYARYAQKYLGVIAPLAGTASYELTSAEISYSDPDRPFPAGIDAWDNESRSRTVSHTRPETGFSRVGPDRTSLLERSSEEMARDAANTIFTLRKRRFDLLTAEAGEGVYGAGLRDAIQELDRMENEYLSLFLGKETVKTIRRSFEVIPNSDKNTYMVSRFDPQEGLLPDSDLSGEPVVLMISAEGAARPSDGGKSDKKNMEFFRVPAITGCRVVYGNHDLGWARIPVLQYGFTVAVSAQR